MTRKPKIQPSPDNAAAVPVLGSTAPEEAAAPTRRGRKARAAALPFASPPVADVASPAPDDAGAGAPEAGPAKAPGRKGQSRKPKQAAGGQVVPSTQDSAAEPQDQAPGQPEVGAHSDLAGDDAPAAATAPQARTGADSDSVQPDRDPASPASGAAQSAPEAEASVSARPAARWDRTTDRVQFDWPAIERVAAEGGPNQAMAKLLVAAWAEGARSRWPF